MYAIPKAWLSALPSDNPVQAAPVDFMSQQESIMAQQNDAASPAMPSLDSKRLYGEDAQFVDAGAAGTLRGQLQANRQGQSRYGAIPQAIAKDPVGVGTLGLGATGIAPAFALKTAAAGAIGGAAESAGLPAPAVAVAQNIPFVGGGSKWAKLGETVLGGVGQFGGNQLDEKLGLDRITPLGGPFANLGNLVGGVTPHAVEAKVKSKGYKNQIKSILGPEADDLDPAVAELLGIGEKKAVDPRLQDVSRAERKLQVARTTEVMGNDGQLYTIDTDPGNGYNVLDTHGDVLPGAPRTVQEAFDLINSRKSIIDQARDAQGSAILGRGVTREEIEALRPGERLDLGTLENGDPLYIMRNEDGGWQGQNPYRVPLREGGAIDVPLDEALARYDHLRDNPNFTDVNAMSRAENPYVDMNLPDLYDARDTWLQRFDIAGALDDAQLKGDPSTNQFDAGTGRQAQMEAVTELRRIQAMIDQRTGKRTILSDSLDQIIKNDPNVEYMNAGFNPFPTLGKVLKTLAGASGTKPPKPHRVTSLPELGGLNEHVADIQANGAANPLTQVALSAVNRTVDTSNPLQNLVVGHARQRITIEGYVNNIIKSIYDSLGDGLSLKDPLATTRTRERGRWVDKPIDTGVIKAIDNATGKPIVVPIDSFMEFPEKYGALNAKQEMARQQALDVIQAAEDYMINHGVIDESMVKAARANMEPGQVYWPRVNKEIMGKEIDVSSRPDLRRKYATAEEAFVEGNRSVGVRDTLQQHLTYAYTHVANAELGDALVAHGVKPSELVTPQMQIELRTAVRAEADARKAANKEAKTTQRLYNEMSGKDINAATVELNLARRAVTRVKGEIAGRYSAATKASSQDSIEIATVKKERRAAEVEKIAAKAALSREQGRMSGRRELTAGREMDVRVAARGRNIDHSIIDPQIRYDKAVERFNAADKALRESIRNERQNYTANRTSRMPTSYGTRLMEAKARVRAAEMAVEDAVKFQAGIPKGKAGSMRMIHDDTLKAVRAATIARRKVQDKYRKEMDALKASDEVPSAFYDPEVIEARSTWNKFKDDYSDQYKYVKATGGDVYRDPGLQAIKQDMKDAHDFYQNKMRDARANNPDAATSVEQWRGKFFPKEQVQALRDGIDRIHGESDNKFIRGFNKFTDIRRELATGYDFGAPFIHGLPLLASHPALWTRGVFHQYKDFLDPTNAAKYIADHYETTQKMAKYGLVTTGSEFYQGAGKSQNALAKQTTGRFAAGYEGALTAWRTALWEALEPSFTRGGLMTRAGTEAELAAHIRNLTGGSDSRALGISRGQRSFESAWVALSPKLLRSTLALVGDTRHFLADVGHLNLTQMNPVGVEAMKSLAALSGAVMLGYYVTGKALGVSEKDIYEGMKPWNGKRFLSHKIDGQWYGVGGQIRAVSQLLGGIYSGVAPDKAFGVDIGGDKPFSDLTNLNSRNPLISFMMSRGAPATAIAGSVIEGATGTNTSGFEQIDGIPDLISQLGKSSLPFSIQGALEGADAMGTVTGMGGLRTSVETPSEVYHSIIDEEVIPQLIASGQLSPDIKSADDLGFGESDLVERYIKDNQPEILDEYKKYRRELGSIYQVKQDERKALEDTYSNSYDNLYQQLLTGAMPANEVFKNLTNVRNQMRGALTTLYNDPEYQKGVQGLESNSMEKLASDYFKIVDEVAKGEKYLTSEQWDEVVIKQQKFMTDLAAQNPALARRFKQDLDSRDSVFDAAPILKLKREVDKASEEYYKTPENLRDDFLKRNPALNIQRWLVYGDTLHSVEAVDMALNRQGEGLTGQAMQEPNFKVPVKLVGYKHRIDTDLPKWNEDKGKLEVYDTLTQNQRTAAMQIPAFNATMIYWGKSDSLKDKASFVALDQMMRSKWQGWEAASQHVYMYLALPESQKDKIDKEHIQAKLPEMDAYVNMWKMFLYDSKPEFKSDAGRIEYARLTGKDTSDPLKYPVVAPKDAR